MKCSNTLLGRSLFAAVALAVSTGVQAGDRDYSAQFTCGSNPASTPRIAGGVYRTSIAARNNSSRTNSVKAEIALTFPPAGPNPGGIIQLDSVQLEPGQAVSFDCDVLQEEIGLTPPYARGVLTLSSKRRLDVTATQTTANAEFDQVTSVNVNRIPARQALSQST